MSLERKVISYQEIYEKLLEEGNTELKDLREILRTNANLVYPID